MCSYICSYLVFLGIFFVISLVFFSVFFFFKQKTAYEMRISDWSSDVCSSDLGHHREARDDGRPVGTGHRRLQPCGKGEDIADPLGRRLACFGHPACHRLLHGLSPPRLVEPDGDDGERREQGPPAPPHPVMPDRQTAVTGNSVS